MTPEEKIEEASIKYANEYKAYSCAGFAFYDGAKSDVARDYWREGYYSEEEVLELLIDFFQDYTNPQNANIKEWFEQNKKSTTHLK